jgi:hypothetical protein
MALDLLYKTKKELKASINKPLKYRETSLFGEELKYDGMVGKKQTVIGGNYYTGFSTWYASVDIVVNEDGRPIITKVR